MHAATKLSFRRFFNVLPFRKFSTDNLKVVEDGGVRKLLMSDTATRNSLTIDMVSNLLRELTQDVSKSSLRAIVISSCSPGVFSSGHNLKELATGEGRRVFSLFSDVMLAIRSCPVPVIATVDGLAAAGGLQLVAGCDIAVATSTSTFSTPGANYGVFCSTPGIPLARSVPRKVAAHMLFTGCTISAEEALFFGLISKVIADSASLPLETDKICDAISAKSRIVIEMGKQFFHKQLEMDLETAYEKGSGIMTNSLGFIDGTEGLRAFAEKRKPEWKHAPYV